MNNAFTVSFKLRYEYTLDNVWDHQHLEFHATFSTNDNKFIGVNDDFYPDANLIFATKGFDNFEIWTTTDGLHRIKLNNVHLLVQLTFIHNYNDSLILP